MSEMVKSPPAPEFPTPAIAQKAEAALVAYKEIGVLLNPQQPSFLPSPRLLSPEQAALQEWKDACARGDLAAVERLIEQGADAKGIQGIAAAAIAGQTEVVRMLIEKGAKVDRYTMQGAAQDGHIETIRLCSAHADMESFGAHVLCRALEAGQGEIARFLMASGIKLGALAHTALSSVAQVGLTEMVRLLLDVSDEIQGAKSVALEQAVEKGHTEIVRLLIEKGADIRMPQLTRSAAARGRIQTIELLMEHGLDINCAFICAAQYGRIELARILFEKGADIHAKNDQALRFAAANTHLEMVRFLLENGADAASNGNEAIRNAGQGEKFLPENSLIVMALLVENGASAYALYETSQKKSLANYIERKKIWRQVVRRDPPLYLWEQDPALFKGTCYESVRRMLHEEGYRREIEAVMALHVSALFGSEARVLQYLKQWGGAGTQPLHDLVHMIRVPSPSPEGVRPNLKDWADGVLKCGPSMARLVKFSDRIPSPMKTEDGRTWSMAKTREVCGKFIYKHGPDHPALAALCFEHAVDENIFEKSLAIVQAKQPVNKNIPDLALTGETFGMPGGKFRRLADGDINGLFLGEMTDCCQSIGGVGAPCAEHGFTSENGGFYVVENARGRVVGQSWAWRGKRGELCLDSLETLGKNVTGDQWMSIINAFRDAVAANNNHNVTALTIGTSGATGNSCPDLKSVFNDRVAAKPCDYDGYRDSDNQILIWKAPHV